MPNTPTTIAYASIALALASHAATYDTSFQKDVDSFDSHFKKIEQHYSAERGMRSSIAERVAKGQNGYLIITSEEVKNGSKVLKDFVQHKEKRGFKVHVITETTWGGGKGRDAANKIRTWLQQNHQKLNLLYCFFIGNPHPDSGDVPMVKVGNLTKNTPEELAEYKEKFGVTPLTSEDGKFLKNTGKYPTDYFYADLSGSWDHDGDTHLGEKADYREGGIDGVWEILVGRLPYYGEESEYGKLADVDVLLQRTIDYENAKDVSWRTNMFYVGGADERFARLQADFFNKSGAELKFYRKSQGYGYEPDSTKWKGDYVAKTQSGDAKFGCVIYQEHGTPRGMAGMMSNKAAVTIKNNHPSYFYLGGCDVSRPEYSENVCYALLRGSGIGVRGGTRSVTSITGAKRINSVAGYERLFFGMSQGEAHWDELAALRLKNEGAPGERDVTRPIGMTNYLMSLYGDPSVVIMPENPSSAVVLAPNRDLTFRHQVNSPLPLGQTYRVYNATEKTQNYTVTTDSGLSVDQSQFSLAPKEARDLKIQFADQTALPIGKTTKAFKVTSDTGSTERTVIADVYPRSVLGFYPLDTPTERKQSFSYRGKDADEAKVFKSELEGKSSDTFAKLIKGANSKWNIPSPGREGFTFSFRFKYDSKNRQGARKSSIVHLFRAGKTECLEIEVEKEVLKVYLNTTRGQYDEEPSRVALELPNIDPDKWHQMILTLDKEAKKATLHVGDNSISKDANFGFGQSVVLDKSKHAMEHTSKNIYLDEIYVTDYPINTRELSQLKKGLLLSPTFPKAGSSVNPEKMTLSWKASLPLQQRKQNYIVAVSENPTNFNGEIHKTTSESITIEGLENNKTYYWKLGYSIGGKNYFTEAMQTFRTDSSVRPFVATIRVNQRALGSAIIGDNTYSKSLKRFVKQEGDQVPVSFSKLEGPSWLQVHPDGSLFTPFGPPRGSEGDNKFKAAVSTENGSSIEFEFFVPVRKN